MSNENLSIIFIFISNNSICFAIDLQNAIFSKIDQFVHHPLLLPLIEQYLRFK
jgi:hypothetical protein